MSISDYIGDSPESQKRRALFERKTALRKLLLAFKLSSFDMTGEEFCSYMRVMGFAHGFLGETEPSEEDIALFEQKVEFIRQVQQILGG